MPRHPSDPGPREPGGKINPFQKPSSSKSLPNLLESDELIYGRSGEGCLVFVPRPLADRLYGISECLDDTWGEFKRKFPEVAQDVLERDFLGGGAITFEEFCRDTLPLLEMGAIMSEEDYLDQEEEDESPYASSAGDLELETAPPTPGEASEENPTEVQPHTSPRPMLVTDLERATRRLRKRLEQMYRELEMFRVPLDDEPWYCFAGSWPECPSELMEKWMPPDICVKYGTFAGCGGLFRLIKEEYEAIVVSELCNYGYRCRRDDELIAIIDWCP
ncbi:MAG TPA: hypothetical protein VNJ11_03220 [Bryobacteraceae bacterium]|nr:hypothetical protein [Bryobacteraceae bacterium]